MKPNTPYWTDAPRRAKAARVPVALLLAALLAGCSTGGSVFGSKSEGTTSASSGSVPFGDRMSALFGGGSQSSAATQASAATTTPTSENFDCPRIDIRPGASTLLINASANEADALGLRYQGTFVRAARECRLQAPNVNIKVGVQGRIILGPQGAPGDLTMPLRYALVQESVGETKVVWSKLYMVPVNIPAGTSSVNFTHITDDLTVPIPAAAALEDYVVYIGYDPLGAEAEKKKKPPPRTPARRR